ncbi:MAG: SDR family oxidoreductase [Christensenellaceae bacterium]|nr:SDR family oxidoreductase [Christensenellaceae bacterium]
MLLEGKKIIVTGGASGIGAACVRKFAEQGAAFIMIVDMNLDMANGVAKEITEKYGTKSVAVKANIVNEEDIDNVFAEYQKHEEVLDVLLNCAGIGKIIDAYDITTASWDLTMNVNVRAAFLFARKAITMMKDRRYGRIINMSSQAGYSGGITIGMDYASSKGALLTLTRSLAKYAAQYDITVNSVAPGLVATAMTTSFGYDAETVPLKRIGTAEEIADATLFLATDLSRYVTGTCLHVNGGILMN